MTPVGPLPEINVLEFIMTPITAVLIMSAAVLVGLDMHSVHSAWDTFAKEERIKKNRPA